jgi:ATP synthase subunit 6
LLVVNVIGLFPYAFAISGQLSTNLYLSCTILFGATSFGIFKKGKVFSAAFIPLGAPGGTLPLLSLLEIASYSARPLSLGIRLFANVMSGHTLAQILSTLVYTAIGIEVSGLLVCVTS